MFQVLIISTTNIFLIIRALNTIKVKLIQISNKIIINSMRIIEVQSSIFIYNKENDENISFFCSIIIRIKNLIKEYVIK